MPNKTLLAGVVIVTIIAVILIVLSLAGGSLSYLFNPPAGLTVGAILAISFVLGLLHGATPDEHTWPITFSYAIGSYSSWKGMKAGFAFSAGFTAQRALLSTLGFLGLASVYLAYNLDGPVYIAVGIAMVISGAYILNKGRYLHISIDRLLGGKLHHTAEAKRIQPHGAKLKTVPIRLAVVHGLIAGFGFGAYATIITFVLAPQMPSIWYAPLPGVFFGIGTMVMQIVFGAAFASFARARKLSEKTVSRIGRQTGGRTLYYGGFLFAVIGALLVAFPFIDSVAISTGNPIPNLDSVGVSTLLVLIVVGGIGIGNLVRALLSVDKFSSRKSHAERAR